MHHDPDRPLPLAHADSFMATAHAVRARVIFVRLQVLQISHDKRTAARGHEKSVTVELSKFADRLVA
jgi:hypothetical protein